MAASATITLKVFNLLDKNKIKYYMYRDAPSLVLLRLYVSVAVSCSCWDFYSDDEEEQKKPYRV